MKAILEYLAVCLRLRWLIFLIYCAVFISNNVIWLVDYLFIYLVDILP